MQTARRDRFEAGLLAAAIGDALGWPYEHNNQRLAREPRGLPSGGFEAWVRRFGTRFQGVEETIGAGEYSDDTQLLIATQRALTLGHGNWFGFFTQCELPAWLLYERGGGRATKAAARSWSKGVAPWEDRKFALKYFDAGGNGVAMRVLPHAFVNGVDEYRLRRDVLLNGIATHGHPRALIGALLYATAVFCAAKKPGPWRLGELIFLVSAYDSIWRPIPNRSELPPVWIESLPSGLELFHAQWISAVREVEAALQIAGDAVATGGLHVEEDVLRQLGLFGPFGGAGTNTAVGAIYLASRFAADPPTGVRTAAYARGLDTDTLASMTGGLLGSMLGSKWLEQPWRRVQDAEFILSLTPADYSHSDQLSLPARWDGFAWTERESRQFKSELKRGWESLNFGPLGAVRSAVPETLVPVSKAAAGTRYRVHLGSGQTVFVIVVSRANQAEEEASAAPSVGTVTSAVASESVLIREAWPDRVLHDLTALAEGIDHSVRAEEFIYALQALIRHILETVGPVPDRGRLPGSDEVDGWLHQVVADGHLPDLPHHVLRALGRIAWRLSYAGGTRGLR